MDIPMEDDNEVTDAAEPNASSSKQGRKRFPSDSPMKGFLNNRDQFLAITLILKGHGQNIPVSCPFCPSRKEPIAPTFRCTDCVSTALMCQDCCIERHKFSPLHQINTWNGTHFERISLRRLGLVIQLDHPDGSRCPLPAKGPAEFTVLDITGLHHVSLNFCGCTSSVWSQTRVQQQRWEQLLLYEWFPSTTTRPKTACTFCCLHQFHLMTLTGKITAFDYYRSLERLTDNTGKALGSRYKAFLRMVRQWRNLGMLRRAGHGNDGERKVDATKPGELAVPCIACPRPGINLPDGWNKALRQSQFLYCLFIAIDACFRLKRKRISSWQKDPSLQDGWAYFVEQEPYKEWVLKMQAQKEMSTCTGLTALDHANTKYNIGYDETGKGAGLCARHEILLANRLGALQVGGRYANMDYIVASLLRHIPPAILLLLSYDIMCQWSKKLYARFMALPPLVCQILTRRALKLVIPKLHILGHLLKCQENFSLLYTEGSGETDAERIERVWSGIGPVATSIKEMGPSSHHDTLEDHCADWNWMKTVNKLLLKRLLNAVKQYKRQYEAWQSFTEHQHSEAPKWMKAVDDFEAKHTEDNPFSLPECGIHIYLCI
ncbi:hypothetical protein VNI00_016503 [Paramarasmius palmivorus]|uniref:CxC2-like cysteine cluster KDZ transposase-associated domain-containing protein n=1 Tax=Paramarasmius palmivorus TaxID=297713 RepID=A0AAW0BDM8_9AGAR